MSVVRVNKNKNYTVMSNYHFKDKNLSLKAKGLLSQMLSLPDDWDYSINGLVSINKESKTAIRNTLKELEENNYLVRTKTHDEHGRIGYIYDIYEEPQVQKPRTENLHAVNPNTENRLQLNTKELNTKELSTNNKKKESKKGKKQSYDELVEGYTSNEELQKTLKAFIQMRAFIKKPMTVYALELMLKKLTSLATSDNEKISILNNSIEHNWQGIFPLKANSYQSSYTTQPKPEVPKKDPTEPKKPDYMDYVVNGKFDVTRYQKDADAYNAWLRGKK